MYYISYAIIYDPLKYYRLIIINVFCSTLEKYVFTIICRQKMVILVFMKQTKLLIWRSSSQNDIVYIAF